MAWRTMSFCDETFLSCRWHNGGTTLAGFSAFVAMGVLLFVTTPVVQAGDEMRPSTDNYQSQASSAEPFHIGTFRTKPKDRHAELEKSSVAPPATSARVSRGYTSAALLAAALEDLKANREKSARRHLELLVVRYPNSLEASRARRHLGRLYAAVEPEESQSDFGDSKGKMMVSVEATQTSLDSDADSGSLKPPPVNDPLSRALGLAVGDRVFFAPGSAELGSKAGRILRSQAQWLSRRPSLKVLVSGYADEPGGVGHNFMLSQKRAESVKDRLIKEGIAENRIQIIAFGRSSPIAKCAKPVCAAQNRRAVTFVLQGPSSHAGLKVDGRKAE